MKKILFAIFSLCFVLTAFSGCNKGNTTVDLSSISFVNVDWERTTDSCVETIYFNDDGSCGYYCACGSPVNDDDLCEGYTFDPQSQTICLDFAYSSANAVKKIKVVSCDGQSLVLDFDGDIRTFEKAKDYDPEYHDNTLVYNGETYRYFECPSDIFYYDLTESVDYEEDEYLPIPHEKWNLVYYNGDLFVLDSQSEDAIAYYADRNNYTWSAVIEDPESEDPTVIPLTMSPEDSNYIYNMEDTEWETTLDFDDIDLFATLIKTGDDRLISGSISLAYFEGVWYWRTEIIDENDDGWPEYTVPLPKALSDQLDKHK